MDILLALGRVETKTLRKRLQQICIERPIYVCGLARSGTTILLELLSEHSQVASFSYRDFPLVMLPFWWDRYLEWNTKGDEVPIERSHKDGIYVTPRSPEAMEEILWMSFFHDSHNPAVCNILNRNHASSAFDAFYKDTILKLLLARGASRYLAKNNYNVTKLLYLRGLFPDVRFVIPVRDPIWHISSLMKQHKLMSQEETTDKRFLSYMRRSGHFEFGLDRRPIHFGRDDLTDEIQHLWNENREVEGWAKYWRCVHSYLADLIEKNQDIACSTFIVDYDHLCKSPGEIFRSIYQFLDLEADDDYIQQQGKRLRSPTYYKPESSHDALETIHNETTNTYERMISLCKVQG